MVKPSTQVAEHDHIQELWVNKLVPLIKYGDSIQGALAQVGNDVDAVFTDFQQYLYEVG